MTASVMLDPQSELGRRASQRLDQERIIRLTTIGQHGSPQPRPVWVYWNGKSRLVYSRPETAKIEPVRRNPQGALHFDADGIWATSWCCSGGRSWICALGRQAVVRSTCGRAPKARAELM